MATPVRILALNDLHLEMKEPGSWRVASDLFDVVVLSGDIHTKGRGVVWAQETFACPVIYVPGNHEGYKAHWLKTIDKMKEVARGSHVHVLHNSSVDIGSLRFLGATLWTSFDAWSNPHEAMDVAGQGRNPYSGQGLNDYRYIRTRDYRKLRPSDVLGWCLESKSWLLNEAAKPLGPGQALVVVTHHPPSLKALKNGVREPIDAAYANNWDDGVLKINPVLWFFGHTHHRTQFKIGQTELTSHPWGYPGQNLSDGCDVWEVEPVTKIAQLKKSSSPLVFFEPTLHRKHTKAPK